MKRTLSIVLALLMALALLAGCGSSSTPAANNTPANNTPANNAPAATDTPANNAPASNDTPAAPADNGKTWNLVLGCIANDPASVPNFNTMGVGVQMFADKVKEYTNGRVNIDIKYASILGNNVSMYEEVMNGTLDFHFGQPMSSADKRYACWSLPFTFDDFDHVSRAMDRQTGPAFKLAETWSAENGVKLLTMGCGAFRGFVSNAEAHVPADAKNMKIRTYEDELVNTFWGKIGTASIIPGSEIYSALQTKTVDAMEFHATGVMSFKLYEVAGFFAPLNWQWTAGSTLSCNMDLWDEFPADIQEAIYKAADEATAFMLEDEAAQDIVAYGVLADGGMKIVELTDSERAEWVAVAKDMEDWSRNFVGADVYDAYMAAVDSVR